MIQQNKNSRQTHKDKQDTRRTQETKQHQDCYNKGLRGILDRITSKHTRIRKQNEQDTLFIQKRDAQEKDQMIFKQLEQSQKLQKRVDRLQGFQQSKTELLDSDIKQYRDVKSHKREIFKLMENRSNKKIIEKQTLE